LSKKIKNIFNIILREKSYFFPQKLTVNSDPLSTLNLNIQSFRNCYPNSKYELFEDQKIREVISKNFKKEILDAYDCLIPFAYKADLARYCLLYLHGGIYSDISHLHINPIQIQENIKMVFFRDIEFIHPTWAVSNAVIYSEPEQDFMYNLICKIVENCNNKFYGKSPLDPTGPYLLGRQLTNIEDISNITFGDSTAFMVGANPSATKRHIIKFMPDGSMIAIRNKKMDSTIDEFIKGGNNYGKLWYDRKVYR
jgi:mannosyltransferase OCH1-like enzyme